VNGKLLTPTQRDDLERAFLDVLRSRRPDLTWAIDGPGKRGDRSSTSTAGEIVGSLTSRQHEGALGDGNGTAGAEHHGVDD